MVEKSQPEVSAQNENSADQTADIVGTTVNTLNLAGGCLMIKTITHSLEVSAAQGTLAEKSWQSQLLVLMAQ